MQNEPSPMQDVDTRTSMPEDEMRLLKVDIRRSDQQIAMVVVEPIPGGARVTETMRSGAVDIYDVSTPDWHVFDSSAFSE